MNNKHVVSFVVAVTAAAVVAATQFTNLAYASVSSYTASAFAQYCAQNPTICTKANESTVSCPTAGQVIQTIYVHGGEGQTVYELPDANWTSVLSNNGGTVTVTQAGQHQLSWVGVVCAAVTTSPTVTPTPTPDPGDPEATPSATPTVTPTP